MDIVNATVIIAAKAGSGKSFKDKDGTWYNMNDNVKAELEKVNKGDVVNISYYKKGVANYVTKLEKSALPSPAPKTEEKTTSSKTDVGAARTETGFKCSDCGTPLKDGKYKKCYDCNMKTERPKITTEDTLKQESEKFYCIDCKKELKDGKYEKCFKCNQKNPSKKNWGKGKSNYDSPEKTAQIQRGNALNAAAAVASGQQFVDPQAAGQFTKMLATDFLEWLRAAE